MYYSQRKKGNIGEDVATSYLEKSGYTIIKRNFYCSLGEIDIIAEKENTLIFIEVKNYPHGFPSSITQVINSKKKIRMVNCAKLFLETYRIYSKKFIRFDVIALNVPGYPAVYHIKEAFKTDRSFNLSFV